MRAEVALHYRDGRKSTIDMQTVEVQFSLDYADDPRMSYEGYGWSAPVARMARSSRTTLTLVGYGETRFTVPAERKPEQRRAAEQELRRAQEQALREARAGRVDRAVVSPATYRRLVELDEQPVGPEPAPEPVVGPWYERDLDRGRWL